MTSEPTFGPWASPLLNWPPENFPIKTARLTLKCSLKYWGPIHHPYRMIRILRRSLEILWFVGEYAKPRDLFDLKSVNYFFFLSLTKDKKQRPKYTKLKSHEFIKRYLVTDVDVGEWYVRTLQRISNDRAAPRYVAWLVSLLP